jgi:hypothetical protein
VKERFRLLLPFFPLSIEGQVAEGSIPSMFYGEQLLSAQSAT